MLEFQNVTAGYRGKTILKNASFRVRRGAITAILGRNGCGKSTLIGCLNGRTEYKGRILLEGKELKQWKIRQRAKMLSVLPQILPETNRTVLEMLEIGRNPHVSLSGRFNAIDEQAIAHAAKIARVEALLSKPMNRISGGERQRAYIAMALAQNTGLIVTDEATTFMDAENEREFFALAKSLCEEEEKTILCVTHSLSLAVNEADEILLLKDGEILFSGSSEEIRNSDIIEKEFSLRKHLYEENGRTKVFYA